MIASARPKPRARRSSARLYGVTGIIGVLAGLAIVYVSYTANGGVPFAPHYDVFVELPNAQRLQPGNDVRIGGIRVGQVQSVFAVPSRRAGASPFARIELALSPSAGPIPANSHVQEQPASILGASYLQLILGTSKRRIASGGTLPISQSTPTVQLPDLLDVFDQATAHSIQSSLGNLADGLAGRGAEFNGTLQSVSELLPPLTRVLNAIASPTADLSRLISGLDATTGALSPVAGELGSLVTNAAITLGSLSAARTQLAATIDELPGTEQTTTGALIRLNPALSGLAQLARELQPGAQLIPTALPALDRALEAGITPLRRLSPFAGDLRTTLVALDSLSRDPAADGSLRLLDQTVKALTTLLNVLTPAQVQCNVIALFGRNFDQMLSSGTAQAVLAPIGVIAPGATAENVQNATPSSNLHVDYLPHENYQQCQAGNEPYSSTSQDLSNPPGTQPNTTQLTSPPPGVTADAASAGLLNPVKGLP